ncbi:MAG: serine--tRNA ligase [Candidatus Bilamarchaeaceae archaeon]
MLDKEIIRNEPDKVRAALKNRQHPLDVLEKLVKLDEEWKKKKGEADALRAERNKLGPQIAAAKKAGKDVKALVKRGEGLAKEIEAIEKSEEKFEEKRRAIMLAIPNLPHPSVPVGKTAEDNREVRKWGTPTKGSGDVEDHHDLGVRTGALDFERGAKLSGHRFTIMKGWAPRLERALINYMLEVAIGRGYMEFYLPYLVKEEVLVGTGQLPKFGEELYRTEDGMWLIPTAEVPLVNIHRDEILEEKALPLKYAAFTPCFRREAGAYGKDIRGLMRQHQFDKVELVKMTAPEKSYEELELMVKDAEEVLRGLELPYKVMELCTGDLGFASAKTYDIEVWVPSQDRYREISSCSNCEEFQARRANIRFRKGGKPEFVHTLNGSGVAVGRCMIALIENFQEDGGIRIPKVLQDYVETDWIEIK